MPNSFGKTVGEAGSFPLFSAELAWLGDMRMNPIPGSHTTGDLLTLFVNYVKQWAKTQSGGFGARMPALLTLSGLLYCPGSNQRRTAWEVGMNHRLVETACASRRRLGT